MQRHALSNYRTALRLVPCLSRTPSAALSPSPYLPCSSTIAGPSRLFSSTPLVSKKLFKKSGSDSPKPAKGKVKDEEASVEPETATSLDGVIEKIKVKMDKAVTFARGAVYDGVERGRGKVSAALLDNIRVQLPDDPSSSTLNSIASVTVKQNTIFVEVWDTDAMKHVESALHKANLPGVSPQKVDQSTLKIPVSRPTVEQRTLIMRNLHTTIESAKQQVRLARSDGIKAVGGKTVSASDEVQDLANEYGKQLDDLLAQSKKEFDK